MSATAYRCSLYIISVGRYCALLRGATAPHPAKPFAPSITLPKANIHYLCRWLSSTSWQVLTSIGCWPCLRHRQHIVCGLPHRVNPLRPKGRRGERLRLKARFSVGYRLPMPVDFPRSALTVVSRVPALDVPGSV